MPELADAVADLTLDTTVERTRDPKHGDFATNVAMRLAKAARSNPRELAAQIIAALPASDNVDKVEIAGPGFINIHMSAAAYRREITNVLLLQETYGRRKKILRVRYRLLKKK